MHVRIRTWGRAAAMASLLAGLVAAGTGHALADNHNTIVVGNDPSTCSDAQFPTIQQGVAAAHPGDTVVVCPGTYVEQVTIPASKNGITLLSRKVWAAVIKAPPVMTSPKAIVRVNGARDASIDAFTITGPGGTGCDSIEYGVRVDTGGSALIAGNHITQIEDTPFGGCQNGIAVGIGRDHPGTPPADPSDVTTGKATVVYNLIDKYQKGGVVVANAGSSGDIEHNIVRGAGSTALIAQNGVQISDGGVGTVENNSITQNIYSPQTVVSTGVLLIQSGSHVQVDGNDVASNDVGIYALQSPKVAITDNSVTASTFAGITLDTNVAGVVVDHNVTSNSTDVSGDGIELYSTSGSKISHNQANNNKHDGIYVDSSSPKNVLSNNKMKGNGTFDAQDDSHGTGTAGTANSWQHNQCTTSSPPGLCQNTDQGGDGGD